MAIGKIKSRQDSVFKVVNFSKSTRLWIYSWNFSCSWSFQLASFRSGQAHNYWVMHRALSVCLPALVNLPSVHVLQRKSMRWAEIRGSPHIFSGAHNYLSKFQGTNFRLDKLIQEKEIHWGLLTALKKTPGLESPHTENDERIGECSVCMKAKKKASIFLLPSNERVSQS